MPAIPAGIAWVVSNHAYISRELDAKTTYVSYAYLRMHGRTCSISVVTNRLFAIAHQMRHSQVLPGYPHFVTCQMLDKINYDQASVQILVCTTEACRCTLLRQVYKFVLSSLSQLYKFVHLNVQIFTRLTGREVYKFVHSCKFSVR